jgi:hypothetical protein
MPTMRRLVFKPQGFMASVVGLGHGEPVTEGTRVSFTERLDLMPHAVIEPGESGIVDYVDQQTGLVEVMLDTTHVGLFEWANHLWLVPFETEEHQLQAIKAQRASASSLAGSGVATCIHTYLLCFWVWAEWLL